MRAGWQSLEAAMVRTQWCVLAVGVGLLTACGTGGGPSAAPESNPATTIAPPTASPSSAADWNLPTGVFRAVTPTQGTLDLHIEPGKFVAYVYVHGIPELGYAADCVPDDPSTITCTTRDGGQMVFGWEEAADALTFEVLHGGVQDDFDVWEPVPWTRLA
jgi:hypothetical protein